MELLARIGVDPGLIRVGRSGAGVDVASHLRVDPKAGQQRPEQHLVRLAIGGGEQIRDVMVTRWRERRLRERPRRDAVLLEERAVQRPLDDQRPLRRFGELHDAIRIWRLRRGKGQRASKADEVVRVLRDVMLEARLAQRARRELRVEGHRADDLVDGGIVVPGLAREGPRSVHGMGLLKPNGARPDVSKAWWAREALPYGDFNKLPCPAQSNPPFEYQSEFFELSSMPRARSPP